MRSFHKGNNRQGAVAPFLALLLVPLLGMLAFSIDMGYICLVKTDLQTAADAAALAAAEKLQSYYVQYMLPGQTNQAGIIASLTSTDSNSPRETAKRFASLNTAGAVNIQLRNEDIEFGVLDANGNYNSSYTGFPNSVTVIARRDGLKNGALNLFFAKIFNKTSADLQATARATIYVGDVTSLKVIPGVGAHILPVALDYQYWLDYYSTGVSPDGVIHSGPNGAPQLHVYPYPQQAPGNFSLVDVGPPANNTPAFREWITEGETPNDIQWLVNNNKLPVSLADPKRWKAGPGMHSTLVTSFQSVLNEPNLIPLFKPKSRQPYQAAHDEGQNATYDIVGFVGVAVTTATGNGSNMDISIQPAGVMDPTAFISNPVPATSTSTSTIFGTPMTTFVSAKLTK